MTVTKPTVCRELENSTEGVFTVLPNNMSYLRFSLMLLALYVCGGQTDPAPLDEININFNLMDDDMGPMGNENVETGKANMEEGMEGQKMESGAEHYPKPTWEPNNVVYCAQGGPSSDPSSGGKPCHVDDGHFCCALQCCPPNTRCGPTANGTCVDIPDKPTWEPNTWHQRMHRHENMNSGMENMEPGMANMEEDSGNMESGAEHYPKPTWEPTWEPNDIVYCIGAKPPSTGPSTSTDPSSGGTKCNLGDGHFCCDKECCAPNEDCAYTKPGKCFPKAKPTWYHH